MDSLFGFFHLVYFFAFLLAPYILIIYYGLLTLQALLTLRPIPDQRVSALTSFVFQCLIPLIGFPIFWFFYWWQPYPNPTEWGSDRNGFIAFYITVTLAIGLAVLTSKLASSKNKGERDGRKISTSQIES